MRDDDYLWNPDAAPDAEIAGIEDALRPLRFSPRTAPFAELSIRRMRPWRWAIAAAVAVVLIGGYAYARASTEPWAVRAIAGSATVNDSHLDANIGGQARIAVGEWLETHAGSSAEIAVGRIGRAEFGPGSRVQLVKAGAREHRLALARGSMHARIWAPPRFFLVQTANALAVDLGCVYSLAIDEQGVGQLSVESGEVELVEGIRRARVPAGNVVSVRPGIGPGLPVRRTAPPVFHDAVRAVESSFDDEGALDRVLDLSTPSTSITVWHLLQRVSPENRERVYRRLVAIAPPPQGVRMEAVLELERRPMRLWREKFENEWTTETIPWWKRSWRRWWTFLLTVG